MIEERQEQLDSLYAETFGGDRKTGGDKPASDLVLDRNAQPSQIKLTGKKEQLKLSLKSGNSAKGE